MKNFNEFMNEGKTEKGMTPRELKMRFLEELIKRGHVKPTANPDGFEKFVEKVLDDQDKE